MIEVYSSENLDMSGVIPIKAWSHSRLSVFEQCKHRTKLAVVDRIPEPVRPLPPGKTEHANDRGTRIHTAAELFIKGGVELISELQWFRAELEAMREEYARGKVSLEGEWGFDREWSPVAWMSSDVWCRIKCDLVYFPSPATAVVVDYKSGKRWGNEVKHGEQVRLYQLGAFLKYPDLEQVTVELWYTDLDELHDQTFTRDQGLMFLEGWAKRGEKMTTETDFQPNPSSYTCKWCPYKPEKFGGTGHCSVGVAS
jgi:hypothetical protein